MLEGYLQALASRGRRGHARHGLRDHRDRHDLHHHGHRGHHARHGPHHGRRGHHGLLHHGHRGHPQGILSCVLHHHHEVHQHLQHAQQACELQLLMVRLMNHIVCPLALFRSPEKTRQLAWCVPYQKQGHRCLGPLVFHPPMVQDLVRGIGIDQHHLVSLCHLVKVSSREQVCCFDSSSQR